METKQKLWRTIGRAYESQLTKGTGGKQIICVIDKNVPVINKDKKILKLYLFPNIDTTTESESKYVIRVREEDYLK